MAFALIASTWMPHVIIQQDYTEISNMAYRGNVLSFLCKVRLYLSKYMFWVLYSEIVCFVYIPVCNILFCPPGVSLLLRTPIYTNLKMIWHTWSSKKKKSDNFKWLYFKIGRPVCWQHHWRERDVRNTCYSYFVTNGLVRLTSSGISNIWCICSCSMCKWGRNTMFHVEITWISNLSLTSCKRQVAHFIEGVDPKLVTAWHCI